MIFSLLTKYRKMAIFLSVFHRMFTIEMKFFVSLRLSALIPPVYLFALAGTCQQRCLRGPSTKYRKMALFWGTFHRKFTIKMKWLWAWGCSPPVPENHHVHPLSLSTEKQSIFEPVFTKSLKMNLICLMLWKNVRWVEHWKRSDPLWIRPFVLWTFRNPLKRKQITFFKMINLNYQSFVIAPVL